MFLPFLLVGIAGFLGGLGAFFFKKASSSFSLTIKGILQNKYLLGGCISYGLSIVFFVPALRQGELSVLYPLVATSYVLAALFSSYFLKEKMTKLKLVSIALIILGVAFLGGS